MVAHDLLHKRQTQPRPLGFGGKERIEDLGLVFRGNARAGIGQLQQHHAIRPGREGDAQGAGASHGLLGIPDKVEQGLADLAFIQLHFGDVPPKIHDDLNARLGKLPAAKLHHRHDQGAKILPLQFRLG